MSAGDHTRAGNAMGRARAGLFAGALSCIAKQGVKATSMIEIADEGKIARATLYNHFRSKGELLRALITEEVSRGIVVASKEDDLRGAVTSLLQFVASHGALQFIVKSEPAVFGRMMAATSDPLWISMRDECEHLFEKHGVASPMQREVLFRLVLSSVIQPVSEIDGLVAAALAKSSRGGATLF
jgi:AcrR family transcriptional regulator